MRGDHKFRRNQSYGMGTAMPPSLYQSLTLSGVSRFAASAYLGTWNVVIVSQKLQLWAAPHDALLKVDKAGTFSDKYRGTPSSGHE